MPDKKHHIDNLFQTGLNGHKVAAPENAWARLHHDLQKPPRRAFFYYSRAVAAAVLLMLAFSAGYFLSEINKNDNPQIVGQNGKDQTETFTDSSLNSDNTLSMDMISDDFLKPSVDEFSEAINQEFGLPKSNNETAQVFTQQLSTSTNINDQITLKESEKPTTPAIYEETYVDNSLIQLSAENAPTDLSIETEIAEEVLKVDGEEIAETPLMTPEMLQRLLNETGDNFRLADIELSYTPENSRWSIGGRVSPVYSYRSLGGDFYTTPDEKVDPAFFDQNEEGITSIAGGISLDYQFNKRLSLGSGMFISRIGQQNNNVLAYNDPDFSNMYKLVSSTGSVSVNPTKFDNAIQKPIANTKDSIPGDYIINGSFVQNLDYLEIPFVLKFKVIESKLSLQLMGGFSPGILVNNRSYFQLDGEKLQTGTTQNIDPFIYNSIVGFGLSYSLSEKLSLNMEPSFKYALSPVNSSTGLNYHPYSFSWFTGISYRIY